MNDALSRLTGAAGIEHGYWDGLGNWRGLEEATAAALLRSLGLDPDGDLDAQARTLEQGDGSEGSVLPPVLIVRADHGAESSALTLTLPRQLCGSPLRWELALESGMTVHGALSPQESAPSIEADNAGADAPLRCCVDLGAPPPLGYHRFSLPDLDAKTTLIVAPARCFIPDALAAGGRCWGLALLLYSLRSSRNWGIGDFTDLADFAAIAGRAGASVIGLNPLHARHLARPDEASPYSPSSRLFLDPMYLDVESIPDFAESDDALPTVHAAEFQSRLAALRAEPLVDHRGVTALKLSILKKLYRHFVGRKAGSVDQRAADFAAFRLRHGGALARFAEFEALRLHKLESDGAASDWHQWPDEWRNPEIGRAHV